MAINLDCAMVTPGNLENFSDGMVIENRDYTITNCVKNCE